MNTKNKTGKFRIIFRFLKGNIRFFVGTLLFSVLFTACNALIPQIVKYTADHNYVWKTISKFWCWMEFRMV